MVTGKTANIASNHPKNIRYPGDGAKLISSNDKEGFTYLGRFTTDSEACGIGIEVTQKAHSALRWLIERQGSRDGEQAVVAWAVSGADVPDPQADTFSFVYGGEQSTPVPKCWLYCPRGWRRSVKKDGGVYRKAEINRCCCRAWT